MDVEKRQQIERRIVERIVDDALAKGYVLSVEEGVRQTRDRAIVMRDAFAMDEVRMTFQSETPSGKRIVVGQVLLVFGNDGHDVIADYNVNPAMEAVLAGAENLADEIAEQEA